jgi:hypothetical protein
LNDGDRAVAAAPRKFSPVLYQGFSLGYQIMDNAFAKT